MICRSCGAQVQEDSKFCQLCGTEVAEEKQCFCSACGEAIQPHTRFCAKCGKEVAANSASSLKTDQHEEKDSRAAVSYGVSILCMLITFVIRVSIQEKYIQWENLLRGKELLGIQPEIQPYLTAIPVITTIIVLLMIVTDGALNTEKKIKTLIINGIFITLSVLFIWFNITLRTM